MSKSGLRSLRKEKDPNPLPKKQSKPKLAHKPKTRKWTENLQTESSTFAPLKQATSNQSQNLLTNFKLVNKTKTRRQTQTNPRNPELGNKHNTCKQSQNLQKNLKLANSVGSAKTGDKKSSGNFEKKNSFWKNKNIKRKMYFFTNCKFCLKHFSLKAILMGVIWETWKIRFFRVLTLKMSFAPISVVIFVISESKYVKIRSFKTMGGVSLRKYTPFFNHRLYPRKTSQRAQKVSPRLLARLFAFAKSLAESLGLDYMHDCWQDSLRLVFLRG